MGIPRESLRGQGGRRSPGLTALHVVVLSHYADTALVARSRESKGGTHSSPFL